MGTLEIRARLEALWDRLVATLDGRGRLGRALLDLVRGVVTALHHLRAEPIFERAAALSYGTVLSVVPLLALVLALAGAFGRSALQERLRDYAFTFLAPGIRQSSIQVLDQLIDRAMSGGVVSASGIALVFSAVTLLRQVERTIDRMWGVREARGLRKRALFYAVILGLGPVLLGASLAASAMLRAEISEAHLPFSSRLLSLGPVAGAVFGLFLFYLLAPNALVLKRAALSGALVAGIAFEASKAGYTFYTAHFARMSKVYGSLAALPLFLVWVYLSWVVVLFGARLAYAVQHANSYGPTALPQSGPARARLLCRTLLEAAVAQVEGRPAPSVHALASRIGLPEAMVAESARLLRRLGLMRDDTEGGLVAFQPMEALTLGDVVRRLEGFSAEGDAEVALLGSDDISREISQLLDAAEGAHAQRLGERSLAEVARAVAAARQPQAG